MLSLSEELLERALEGGKGVLFGEENVSLTLEMTVKDFMGQTSWDLLVRLRRLVSPLWAGRSHGRV